MDWYKGHGAYEMTNLKGRTLCIASKVMIAHRTRQFNIYEQYTRQEVDQAVQAGKISVRFLHGDGDTAPVQQVAETPADVMVTPAVAEVSVVEEQSVEDSLKTEAVSDEKTEEEPAVRNRRRGRKED